MITILMEFAGIFGSLIGEYLVPVLLLTIGYMRFEGGANSKYRHGMSSSQVLKTNIFLTIITFITVLQMGAVIYLISGSLSSKILSLLEGVIYLSLATWAYININFSPKLIREKLKD